MSLIRFFVSIAVAFLLTAQITFSQTLDPKKPAMLKDNDYTEYWEQYFYLDDGSLVTSQFLVANFPWPVGDEHGIMLGTLVTPEGELYVIKNGRDLGEWGFDKNSLDLFIHTHRIKERENGYSVHLENTMGIVDLELSANLPTFNHPQFASEDGFIETSFYAPNLKGQGNWQLGPEAGFNPTGPVHNIGAATGFGVHVLMTDKADKLIDDWTRIIGITQNAEKPFLSAIRRPNGQEDIIFKLISENDVLDEFSNVKISYNDLTREKDADYPKEIKIEAQGKNGEISGTIQYRKKFAHFNLTDHLNFFEKSFAKSNPFIVNFRYLSEYNFVYKTASGEKTLTGQALSEYTDIQPAKKTPAKKRRRNRR